MTPLARTRFADSFADLLPSLRPKIERVLRRYRVSAQDAEDLIQDSLVILLQRWDEVECPEAWLIGTLKWRCVMHWRGARRQLAESVDAAILDLLAEPQAPAQEKIALRRDLGRALDQLSPRCRDLLRLRYGMGMRPGEVAAQLDYRPSSIRKVVGRCQLVLCEQLLALGYPVKLPVKSPRGAA